jgi:predicted DNA-binding transcriptional regulator AlpA
MTARRADLADLSHWPCRLSREQAAAYCGLSPASFDREVDEGRLPDAIRKGRRALWDIKALDRALDAEIGEGEPSSGFDPYMAALDGHDQA